MRWNAGVSSLVTAVLVNSELHPKAVDLGTTCSFASDRQGETTCVQPQPRDQVLLQLHSEAKVVKSDATSEIAAESATLQAWTVDSQDDDVSAHVEKIYASPKGIASAMQKGFQVVSSAMPFLQQKDLKGALQVLGPHLEEAVSFMLPPQMQWSTGFAKFKERWVEAQGGLLKILEADTAKYAASGDLDAFVHAFETIFQEASSAAGDTLPVQANVELSRYMRSVVDALDGVTEGLSLVEEGQQVDGVQAYFDNVQESIGSLVKSPKPDVIESIIGLIDGDIGSIAGLIVGHTRGIISSRVCWKRTAKRQRARPSLCDSDHDLKGRGWRLWCQPKNATGVYHPARCSLSGELKGTWCYYPCQPGYEPKFHHCRQACRGTFWVDSPLLCGDSEGSVGVALLEMVAKTAMAASTQVGLIGIAKDAGIVAAGSMSHVMQSFVQLSQPFGHPWCPDAYDGMDHSSMR